MSIRTVMRLLTALILSDNRPGHYHLSDGVIAALRRLRPVRVHRMVVHRQCSGHLAAWLSNLRFPPQALLRLIYGLAPSQVPSADIIVSAGAETLPASAAIARLRAVPNIFCGSLRHFHHDSFRLVLTSYPSHADRPRHVMVLKPSALSRDVLRRASDRCSFDDQSADFGLLLGGDSGECRYQLGEWMRLLDLVECTHQALGVRWHISNSRRTPAAVSDLVAKQHALASSAIASFIDVRTAGHGTLDRVLGHVHAVVCTDDSSTMISECVSAGIPVLGVRARSTKLTPDEQGYREYLIQNGWYRSVPIAELTPLTLLDEVSRLRPLAEDPLDKLAAILREHLPELFLEADSKVGQKAIKLDLSLPVAPLSAPLPFPRPHGSKHADVPKRFCPNVGR